MTTPLLLIAPLPLFFLYAIIRLRFKRRAQPITITQVPAPQEKPYEPQSPRQPNAFLRLFPLTTQLYLRRQWDLSRFGFFFTLWILTAVLCGSLFPPFTHTLPTADQRVWLRFVTEATVWGAGFPIVFVALFAALVTVAGIIDTPATFPRTRPIPLRVIFWGRILPALAVLLLAAAASIAIAFIALRISYGPVWHSVPTSPTADGAFQAVIHMPADGTVSLAEVRRLLWLAGNPAPRIFASAITTMTLFYSVFVLMLFQPFGVKKKSSYIPKLWIIPIAVFVLVTVFNQTRGSSTSPFLSHLTQLLFYNLPFHVPPTWRFLPVPIVLSLALLFLCERLYLHRDI